VALPVCLDVADSALELGAVFCLDDPKAIRDAISDRHIVTLVLGEVHRATAATPWAAETFVPSIDHRRLLFCVAYDSECDRRCTKTNTRENSIGGASRLVILLAWVTSVDFGPFARCLLTS
jgi:hypothetical protein